MKHLLSITLGMLFLSACSNLGPQFATLEKPATNQSLVYFYRPSAFVGGGSSQNITEDGSYITTMYNGGYFPYGTSSGKKNFIAETFESKEVLPMTLEKGKTYFVRYSVSMGILTARPHFELKSKEDAIDELKQCKLIKNNY